MSSMLALTEKKSADYGVECWQALGLKSVFTDINRKYWRLKNLIWHGNPAKVSDENIEDTLLDLANHCLQGLLLLKDDPVTENLKKAKKRTGEEHE